MRDSLETFLAHARESYAAPMPRYVEQELRSYLRCGVFAHGFVRAHCDACGHDLLVAFSCKGRGVCPSCSGRRMANTAAALVDRVLPDVPVRQWVLTLPFELRALAARRADVLAALNRMFIEALFARYRSLAQRAGWGSPQCGGVTFVQRFGSSLNLNVHFHFVALDGTYMRDGAGRAAFHPSSPPTRTEMERIAASVQRRALAWLERRRLLVSDPSDASQEPPAQTSLDACTMIAMHRGELRAFSEEGDSSPASTLEPRSPLAGSAVDHAGFNLEASIRIAAGDDLGRERLCRYGARPPFALARLKRLPGGRIAYKIKKLRARRAKHRVMTPLEFLARLSALIPPPRYPLLRFHGVLAPRSSWRKSVVPKPRTTPPCTEPAARDHGSAPEQPTPRTLPGRRAVREPSSGGARNRGTRDDADTSRALTAIQQTPEPKAPFGMAPNTPNILSAPNILSVSHWSRLAGGLLYAHTTRVDWARLMRRTFDVDVLRCPSCQGRLRVLGEITAPSIVGLILQSVGLPREVPALARARDSPDPFEDPQAD